MKRTLLLFSVFLATAVLPASAQSSLSTEAQRAYVAGNIPVAKEKFKQILVTDPQNPVARNYLKMIAATETKTGPREKLQAQLASLIVPKVEFKDATLESALDYLRQQAGKVSDGKVQTSFLLEPGVNSLKPITLRLTTIPFTEVLHYVANLAGVQFSIEQYAITVKPKSADASPAPAVQ